MEGRVKSCSVILNSCHWKAEQHDITHAEADWRQMEDERTAAERYDELLAEVGLSDEDEEGDPAEEFENDVFTLPDED